MLSNPAVTERPAGLVAAPARPTWGPSGPRCGSTWSSFSCGRSSGGGVSSAGGVSSGGDVSSGGRLVSGGEVGSGGGGSLAASAAAGPERIQPSSTTWEQPGCLMASLSKPAGARPPRRQ
ncbi:MAG: hypothetical protein C4547_04535 [Phycisphaerales bacterium]|nr:MAG: hypothetical protein C4547_04535 [Phycisphaerales bacterium]